ncbi:pilus assembly protein CpaC [Devosia sp. D6-9]|jgi:Flp pilus assembly secretin CpaC|nr:pilus assembly protein CpaC [Devosia sp. D6-9]
MGKIGEPSSAMSRITLSLALVAVLASSLPVAAVDTATAPISVKVNMARVLRINSPASTVIVGNPAVADVTIQDPLTLVLTGKSYGQTNLIVLNATGNPIADTLVEVVQDQANLVTVFNAGARFTYACPSRCAPTVMLGDSTTFTEEQTKSLGLVKGVQN